MTRRHKVVRAKPTTSSTSLVRRIESIQSHSDPHRGKGTRTHPTRPKKFLMERNITDFAPLQPPTTATNTTHPSVAFSPQFHPAISRTRRSEATNCNRTSRVCRFQCHYWKVCGRLQPEACQASAGASPVSGSPPPPPVGGASARLQVADGVGRPGPTGALRAQPPLRARTRPVRVVIEDRAAALAAVRRGGHANPSRRVRD